MPDKDFAEDTGMGTDEDAELLDEIWDSIEDDPDDFDEDLDE